MLGSTITFITSITHRNKTLIQSAISAVLAFIVGITIGIIMSYVTQKKEIIFGCISAGTLLSDAIIKYIITNDYIIVKKIFKSAENVKP